MKHLALAIEQNLNESRNVSMEDIQQTMNGITYALESISTLDIYKKAMEETSNVKETYKMAKLALASEAKSMDFILSDFVSMESHSDEALRNIALEGISDFIRNVWEAIKAAFKWMWDKISGLFSPNKEREKKKKEERLKALLKELKDDFDKDISIDPVKLKENLNKDENLIQYLQGCGHTDITPDVFKKLMTDALNFLKNNFNLTIRQLSIYETAVNTLTSEPDKLNVDLPIITRIDQIKSHHQETMTKNSAITELNGIYTNEDSSITESVNAANKEIVKKLDFKISPFLFSGTWMFFTKTVYSSKDTDGNEMYILKLYNHFSNENNKLKIAAPDSSEYESIYNYHRENIVEISDIVKKYSEIKNIKKYADDLIVVQEKIMENTSISDTVKVGYSTYLLYYCQQLQEYIKHYTSCTVVSSVCLDVCLAYIENLTQSMKSSKVL